MSNSSDGNVVIKKLTLIPGGFDPEVEFRCTLCQTRNKKTEPKCRSCETANPTYDPTLAPVSSSTTTTTSQPITIAPAPIAPTGGFTFGAAPSTTSSSSSSTSTGGFAFGGNTGFTFGTTDSTGFVFTPSSTTTSTTETSSSSSTGFVFQGAPIMNQEVKKDDEIVSPVTTTTTTTEESSTIAESSSTVESTTTEQSTTESTTTTTTTTTTTMGDNDNVNEEEEEAEEKEEVEKVKATRGRKPAATKTPTKSTTKNLNNDNEDNKDDEVKATPAKRGRKPKVVQPPTDDDDDDDEDKDMEAKQAAALKFQQEKAAEAKEILDQHPTIGRRARSTRTTITTKSTKLVDSETSEDDEEGEDEAESTAPVAKKRGRPAKNASTTTTPAKKTTTKSTTTKRAKATKKSQVDNEDDDDNNDEREELDLDEIHLLTTTDPIPITQRPQHYGNGIALTCGFGDCAQLGIGYSTDDSLRFRKFPAIIRSLQSHNIVAVAAGALHNLALTSTGQVYSWGCNDDGALGRLTKQDETAEFTPTLVTGLENEQIIAIAAGASHSLALSISGKVFSWGAYRDAGGLIGFDEKSLRCFEAMLVPGLNRAFITRIACGESHCLALARNGDVYYWGDVFIGRRQSDRRKIARLQPQLVTFRASSTILNHYKFPIDQPKTKLTKADTNIVHIFTGGYTCCAISESGLLWIWGPNNYTQTGISQTFFETNKKEKDESPAILTPTICPFFIEQNLRVIGGCCASQYTIILTHDRRVWAFGRTAEGRLGQTQDYKYIDPEQQTIPLEITTLSPTYLSSEASWSQPLSPMVTTTTNEYFKGPKDDCIVGLSCGESHALAITKQGRILGWGAGDSLQLGNALEQTQYTPYWIRTQQLATFPRHVISMGCGSQHTIFLAKDSIDNNGSDAK